MSYTFLAPNYLQVSASRFGFLVFQLFHLILLAAVGHFESYKILIFSGTVNVLSYGWLLVRELRVVNNISPLQFYLIASILRMGVCCIYTGFVLMAGFEGAIQIGPIASIITDYLIQGHMILMIGDMAFILGYWAIKNSGQSNITGNLYSGDKFFLSFWIAVILLIFKIINTQFLFFENRIFNYFIIYGTPGCLFVMLKSLGASTGKAWYVKASLISLVTIIMVLFALRSYMKSDLLIVLFPFILIFVDQYLKGLRKSKVSKIIFRALGLSVLLYFLIVTMTSYSEVRRAFISNQYLINEVESVEIAPFLVTGLLTSIPGTEEFDRYNTFPKGGAWNFLSRLTVTNLGAWSYKEVQDFGYWDRNFLSDLLVSIIPRVFWPEKPDFWPGRIFATKVGHADTPETATTSTALTMAASFYWWGGIIATILGMSISGLLVATIYRFVQHRQTSNPIAALVAILLFYSSLIWFEGSFYGTVQLALYVAIVFLPLIILYEKLILNQYQKKGITRS